jgi:hypothetical protein
MCVAAARVMTYPVVILGMNVRRFRMSRLVIEMAALVGIRRSRSWSAHWRWAT